jgi:hypothetical protein
MLEHSSHKINVHENEKRVKVVMFGSYHSGKTSFIKSIDPHLHQTEAKNHEGTTTVALDLGIKEHKGYKIYLFGTPGQERFEVAREVVSFGLHVGVVLVDSTRGMTEFEKHILKELSAHSIPCVVVANKIDLPGSSVKRVEDDTDGHQHVIPVSSLTGEGVCVVLDRIVELIAACN